MASNRQNPASPSDPMADVPLATRVRRQGATGPAGQPGTIRVVAVEGDTVHESEGTTALTRLPEHLRQPGRGRLGGPRRADPGSGEAGR